MKNGDGIQNQMTNQNEHRVLCYENKAFHDS